jgi:phenylpropionate dioxygenase-like ring-hydroxylating dioxygenase large terminal subunit
VTSRLRYWHPVLAAAQLPMRRPVAVRVAGRNIALFRTPSGRLGALEDRCVHRRLKLSAGRVVGERLRCAYHGWSFTTDGHGESPGTPRLHGCAASYACCEAYGAIWVREREAQQPMPDLRQGYEDWHVIGCVTNPIEAPLPLLLDNFAEVEHTVAVHRQFGIDIDRASESALELEATSETFTARNRAPSKPPPLATRLMVWTWTGDEFHSDYTFRFDPPRSSVTHYWTDRAGRERMVKYHLYHYFVPVDAARSMVVTFGHLQSRWPGLSWIASRMAWLVRAKIRSTIDEDAWLLKNLADYDSGLEGMKLGRFDRVLGLARERLERLYGEDGYTRRVADAPGDRPPPSGEA